MRFDFDIAIVGGGPAGSSTALHLVRAHGVAAARVLLLDKARHPRDKPCAGAVSAWGLRALARLGVPLAFPHVPMRGLRVVDGRGGEGACHYPGLGAVVRRAEFDASLWRAAASDGVRARDGEALVGLERIAGGFRLDTTHGAYRAHLVAACDGVGSTVRRLLGLGEVARKGHLLVLETDPTPFDAGAGDGLCGFDLSPCRRGVEGYYWDFPTLVGGRPAVSRGIYHANLTPSRDVKPALVDALARRGVDGARVRPKPFSARPFVASSPLALDRVALVGEAAGIDATTGEGIAQAILFGALAAEHLARARRRDSGCLDAYVAAVRGSHLGRHLLQSAWLAPRVYGPRGSAWRRFLARSAAAREAGTRWYAGERLGLGAKGWLAFGLARAFVREALGDH